MRYIFNMGLSGSVLCLLYLCAKTVLAECMEGKQRYLLLKCILLYYLVPIPYLQDLYSFIWEKLFLREGYRDQLVVYAEKSLMLRWGDKIYLNQPMQFQLWTTGIWAGIAGMILFYKCVAYLRERKLLSRYSDRGFSQKDFRMHDVLENTYSVKQKVIYIDSTPADNEGNTAFTIGILRPMIFYPLHRSQEEKQMILEHELIHVKNRDVLWRVLMSCACILHWFNPLVWWLAQELECTGETVCDEILLQNRSPQERRRYAELLVAMSCNEMEPGGWSVALNRKNKRLKERLENIMRKDKRYLGGFFSALLLGALVFLNSFTVLAYEDVQVWKDGAHEEDTELSSFMEGDLAYVPDRENASDINFWQNKNVTVLYDHQFTDEEGNVYPVYGTESDRAVYASCNHQYETGTVQTHVKNSSGGCTITVYSAKRCTKCGLIVRGEITSTHTYVVCTH